MNFDRLLQEDKYEERFNAELDRVFGEHDPEILGEMVWAYCQHFYLTGIEDAKAQLSEVLRELQYQWFMNHAEHCQNDWPHEGACFWQRPDIL